MSETTNVVRFQPDEIDDLLTNVLRAGARQAVPYRRHSSYWVCGKKPRTDETQMRLRRSGN
jgi:hypothetical protein